MNVHFQDYLGQWRLCLSFLSLLDLLSWQLTMAHFYARKELYMASPEGSRNTYTCLCQRTNVQAVCVDVKLLGTTEGLYKKSATLVLLHKYGRFVGAYIMGIWYCGTHIMIYLMLGSVRVWSITLLTGFPHLWPLMDHLSPHLLDFSALLRTNIDTFTSYMTWKLHTETTEWKTVYRNINKKY
jgi:hypothetical protein